MARPPAHASRRAMVSGARRGTFAAMLLATWLSGCTTLGPDYQAPQLNLPSRWIEAHGDFTPADRERLRTWWRAFKDPTLDRLVDRALVNNQNLGIAQARLQQARAERVGIASGLGPTVSTSGVAQALRSSRTLNWPPGIGESRTWSAGFDASWELDMFGGTRRAVESVDAGIDALAADHRALQVSLLAELAATYVELRMAQARLVIARDTIHELREGERLAERALQHGLGTSTEVAQARVEREVSEARPPALEADIARLSHAVGVLTGGFPGDWRTALTESEPVLLTVPALPLTLPSEMIRQRPDLQADERRLAGATAHIGAAEAARFPRFSIPLSLGTTASLLHDLFSGASLAWSAAFHASHTLYDGGRGRAGVTAAKTGAAAARLIYERDVRLALRDVEDALTALNSERRRQAALTEAVDDSRKTVDRAIQLYRRGLSGYLPVLVAGRAAHRTRDALLVSQWNEVRGAIVLHKALGAGWQDESAADTADNAIPKEMRLVARTAAGP